MVNMNNNIQLLLKICNTAYKFNDPSLEDA
jgi:hypothetical protein